MSRTLEEKRSEDISPTRMKHIEAHYDLIEHVKNLDANDIAVLETSNEIEVAIEIVNPLDEPEIERNDGPVFETLAYDGPDWMETGSGEIIIDYAGADGSLGDWKGVPYLTVVPADPEAGTWGDVVSLEMFDDADAAITEVDE